MVHRVIDNGTMYFGEVMEGFAITVGLVLLPPIALVLFPFWLVKRIADKMTLRWAW